MISLQNVEIQFNGHSEQGRLVFLHGRLLAVVVLLSNDIYAENRGRWHIEAAFQCDASRVEPFPELDNAVDWIVKSRF